MRNATWILVLLVMGGCSGGISQQVREEAVPVGSFAVLRAQPERYRGETVILGGEIIETRNTPGLTTFLILERALSLERRPKTYAASGGRFMVRFQKFLDPAQFTVGRQVTSAGRVVGIETEMVGEAPYGYVLLEGREIHLWEDHSYDPYGYGYYPYFYHPYPYSYPYPYYRRHRPW